jgi:glucokinase
MKKLKKSRFGGKAKFIGVDVGGSKILLQVFDAKLSIIDEKKVKTDVKHGRAGVLRQLYRLVDEFFSKSVRGIGIAVPGIVNQKTGALVMAPNIPTGRNLRLKALFTKRYGVSVHVENDINAFLMAEHRAPRLRKYSNILAVMLGTGLGGAAIVNGGLIRGKNGYAGEFGHMVIRQSEKLKTLEENAGGRYLAKHPKLKKDLTENFGLGLANLNLIFNPEVIILGGSVYFNYLRGKKKQLERIIKKHSLSKESPKLIDASSRTSTAKGAVLPLI